MAQEKATAEEAERQRVAAELAAERARQAALLADAERRFADMKARYENEVNSRVRVPFFL